MMQSAADSLRQSWFPFWPGARSPWNVEGGTPADPVRELLRPWNDLYRAWTDAVGARPWPGMASDDCRCPKCRRDECHCRCCIADSDLLVRARVLERRIVPIVIENNWRREREIELELSGWSPSSERVAVNGGILSPTRFTLKPCEERTVVLRVDVGAEGEQGGDNNDTATRTPPDVRECTVFYADLRIVGCDIRPIRIAVAVLPRDCDAYRIDCRCACCC